MTSRAQELLDAAWPLPWYRDGTTLRGRATHVDGPITFRVGAFLRGAHFDNVGDARLAEFAVNALPAYEAAREALDRLLSYLAGGDDEIPGVGRFEDEARVALARLRDEVPA